MTTSRQMMTSYFARLADGQVVFYPQYQYLKTLPERSTRAGYYLNNPEDQTKLQALIDRHQWQIQFLWIAFCFIPLAITSIPEPLAGGYGRLYAKLVMTLLAMLSIAKFETNWQKKLTQRV